MIKQYKRIEAGRNNQLLRLLNVAPSGDKSAYSELSQELVEIANGKE